MDEARQTMILEAIAEAMAARGVGGGSVTTAELIARADISEAELQEQLGDRDACLLAAFELALERAEARTVPAFSAEPRWLDAIKAGLVMFLRFLEDEPALGMLLVVYSTSGDEALLRRRAQVLATLAAAVDLGRREVGAGRSQPPPVIAEGIVGALLAVVQNRLLSRERGTPMELFGSLVSIVVLPYLGPGAARRELTRPAPRVRLAMAGSALPGAERMHEHAGGVRLTYRTMRVMSAIGDYPGASNREVAERAGVVDQGQISKLLTRLELRGLIAKGGDARARGAPNSWRLTQAGEQLLRSAPDASRP